MYIFFLDFSSHYSQQRSAVRSTALKSAEYNKKNLVVFFDSARMYSAFVINDYLSIFFSFLIKILP